MKSKSNTVIAAIKNRSGKIVMAADRRASFDWGFAQEMAIPKLIKLNGLVMGFTGVCAIYTLIRCIPLETINIYDPELYLQEKFAPLIEKKLKQHGFKDEHNLLRIPSEYNSTLLIGLFNRLFLLNMDGPDTDSQTLPQPSLVTIEEVGLPFAVGCGDSAMHLLMESKRVRGYNIKEDLHNAVEHACKVSPGCSLPIDYIQED
jgi:hypothetical protein